MRRAESAIALQINDLAVLKRPYWVYRDMTWRQVASYGGDTATGAIDRRLVRIHCWHEGRVYRKASGVFSFSAWAARSIREIGADRVVVVPPGVNVPVGPGAPPASRSADPRILFVGRAFERKGGPALLKAMPLLRRRLNVTLDVVGPPAPPSGTWPDGVVYHGPLSPAATSKLFEGARLLVLPSYYEAYGIALVEALCHGLPCVARGTCAMPEILADGKWGHLVASDDPLELASAIAAALADEALHDRVWRSRPAFVDFYSWNRAARQMLVYMLEDVGANEESYALRKTLPDVPA